MTEDIAADSVGALRTQLARLRLAVVVLGIAWLAMFVWLMIKQPAIPRVLAVERLEM